MKYIFAILSLICFSLTAFSQENINTLPVNKNLLKGEQNLIHVDTIINSIFTIDKLHILKLNEYGQAKNAINAYCSSYYDEARCDSLNKKVLSVGKRIDERIDNLHTGNYVNPKLKNDVDTELARLNVELPILENLKACNDFEYYLINLENKFRIWTENNEKMPEWKASRAKQLNKLRSQFDQTKEDFTKK